jgi:hypothetical protein
MSSSFIDYLDTGKYVNDKNLDVQNIRIESATSGLTLVVDASKKVVSTNFGTNLFLTKWGNTYVSLGAGIINPLPLVQVGGLAGVQVNTALNLVGNTINIPAGSKSQGGYKVVVSYFQETQKSTTMSLRLDGTEVLSGSFTVPTDASPAGLYYFETFLTIADDLAHNITLVYTVPNSPVVIGNVSVEITRIA